MDQGLGNIARFKSPSLRDGKDSAPYFYNRSKPRFDDVVEFYINSSQLARLGSLRNPPAEFQNMSLSEDDGAARVAFLKSLTEDYDDSSSVRSPPSHNRLPSRVRLPDESGFPLWLGYGAGAVDASFTMRMP